MIKNILKLVKGNLLSRLIVVLAVPILTRIYSPEEMGVVALFTSSLLIISPLLNLRYSLTIPLPKTSLFSSVLVTLNIIIIIIISLILIMVTFFYGEEIYLTLGLNEIYEYRYILITVALFISVSEVLNMWVIREKMYRFYSSILVKQSLLGSIVKILAGLIGLGIPGLLLGTIVQNLSGTVQCALIYLKRGTYSTGKKNKLFAFFYYLNYLYYKFPAHFLYVVSAQLPILYGSKYYDSADVGHLSLAMSLIAIPMSIISRSVSKVYFSEMSSIGKKKIDEIYLSTINILPKLILIGLIVSISTYIISPFIFEFILGDEWATSGDYARALSFSLIFQISATTLITILNVINLNFLSFFIHTLRFLIVLVSFWYSFSSSQPLLESIYIYSYGTLFFYFIITFLIVFILHYKKNLVRVK